MLLLDLPAMRQRLLGLPWVLDASVARHWPDRIVVHVVERRPVAIWQHQGRLHLIDRQGGLLPSDRLDNFSDLPLVIGPGAEREVAPLLALMADQPDVARRMKAATWVGGRRWDLKMETGETLSLPQGPAARGALRRFAAIERETPLLGRGFQRFDMRIPDRLVVRVATDGGRVRPRAGAAPPSPGGALPGATATAAPALPAAGVAPGAHAPAEVTI
jgi:cell division protein FtsQ